MGEREERRESRCKRRINTHQILQFLGQRQTLAAHLIPHHHHQRVAQRPIQNTPHCLHDCLRSLAVRHRHTHADVLRQVARVPERRKPRRTARHTRHRCRRLRSGGGSFGTSGDSAVTGVRGAQTFINRTGSLVLNGDISGGGSLTVQGSAAVVSQHHEAGHPRPPKRGSIEARPIRFP